MTRSSVDLPLPLGPSSAVSEPASTETETSSQRGEVSEPLRDPFDDDRHYEVPSLGLKTLIRTSVPMARSASRTDAAYAAT